MGIDTEWAQRVGQVRGGLTKTEETLLSFISAAPHISAFMSLKQLCESSGVSKPVVIEFYRKLGYADFKEFREGLQGFYSQHIDSYRASTTAFRNITTIDELIAASVDVDVRSLQRMAGYLSREQLGQAARRILDAPNTYLFAPGTGFYPAHYLCERLRRYHLRAHLIGSDIQHLAEELFPIREGDLLLVFEYVPESDICLRVMDRASDAGAHIILVTEPVDVPLVNRADSVIVVNRGELGFKNSMAVPMSFANLMLLTIELVGGKRIADDLKTLEETRERYALSRLETS
ncbi:MAG TPA: MurR/RpiR family transcriptional regulator [Spirochaetia bacterium]|nr:MurR/RpiR family transcriptional regulator [Spirochaetia bacterium]